MTPTLLGAWACRARRRCSGVRGAAAMLDSAVLSDQDVAHEARREQAVLDDPGSGGETLGETLGTLDCSKVVRDQVAVRAAWRVAQLRGGDREQRGVSPEAQ